MSASSSAIQAAVCSRENLRGSGIVVPCARSRFRCKADSSVLSACCPQTPVPQSPTAPRERTVSAINMVRQQVSAEISTAFERRLDQARVLAPQRPEY